MARTKQTARKSTGGKAPRTSLNPWGHWKPPPKPEHNYLEEARQLAGWRRRATTIDPPNLTVNRDDCVFDIWTSALRSSSVVLLLCKPDICFHFSGNMYRLDKQDFDGFVALAHAAVAECAKIGNLSRPSGGTCSPHTILRVVQGTETSSAGNTYAKLGEARYTNFFPWSPKQLKAQASSAESSGDEEPLPELHALSAILSLAYVGDGSDESRAHQNAEVQNGPISEVMRMFEHSVYGRLQERLNREEQGGEDEEEEQQQDEEQEAAAAQEEADPQKEVDAQIQSELREHMEAS